MKITAPAPGRRTTASWYPSTPTRGQQHHYEKQVPIRLSVNVIQVTILSRHDCYLCDVAINVARRLQMEFPFSLSYVDIANDEHLSALYSARIPVIFIDQVETFSGKITEGELRQAIKRARWRRPISRILFHLRQWLRRR